MFLERRQQQNELRDLRTKFAAEVDKKQRLLEQMDGHNRTLRVGGLDKKEKIPHFDFIARGTREVGLGSGLGFRVRVRLGLGSGLMLGSGLGSGSGLGLGLGLVLVLGSGLRPAPLSHTHTHTHLSLPW